MAFETVLAERDLERPNACTMLPVEAHKLGLTLMDRLASMRSTFSSQFTTTRCLDALPDQLAEIEALARQTRQALRRGR